MCHQCFENFKIERRWVLYHYLRNLLWGQTQYVFQLSKGSSLITTIVENCNTNETARLILRVNSRNWLKSK